MTVRLQHCGGTASLLRKVQRNHLSRCRFFLYAYFINAYISFGRNDWFRLEQFWLLNKTWFLLNISLWGSFVNLLWSCFQVIINQQDMSFLWKIESGEGRHSFLTSNLRTKNLTRQRGQVVRDHGLVSSKVLKLFGRISGEKNVLYLEKGNISRRKTS